MEYEMAKNQSNRKITLKKKATKTMKERKAEKRQKREQKKINELLK